MIRVSTKKNITKKLELMKKNSRKKKKMESGTETGSKRHARKNGKP
jgi:hypothetical protein